MFLEIHKNELDKAEQLLRLKTTIDARLTVKLQRTVVAMTNDLQKIKK